jgi:Sulfotransferase family
VAEWSKAAPHNGCYALSRIGGSNPSPLRRLQLAMPQLLKKSCSENRVFERKYLPTFIGIGSMRCGSTWLYEVLKCHPDVHLAECKELDFFFMRKMLRHDLDWYEVQFEPGNGAESKPIRGEISPLYARLKAWQVNRIAELLPNTRIILTLRHPIERVWSQALYEFGHRSHRDLRTVRATEFLRQVERPRNKLSSDYYRTIKVWSDAFGPDALHIGFFDQLRDDPEAYINSVLKHIGASVSWTLPETFKKRKVWATNSLVKNEPGIPEVVQWYIADRLLEPTERLNELLKGRVSNWVEEMRTIRGKAPFSWRILKDVNRFLLSVPERLAYEVVHALLDFRLWLRWQQFQRAHAAREKRGGMPAGSPVVPTNKCRE